MKSIYQTLKMYVRVYCPTLYAKIFYYLAYGSHCNLKTPQTLSEKLLWLWLHTYRNNFQVLTLCDKYKVREFVEKRVGKELLNELYCVFQKREDISYDKLPNSFALKITQGCTANLFCQNKQNLSRKSLKQILKSWDKGQYLYDKMMSDIGGITRDKLDKCYICEKYLTQKGYSSPIDYKIYCFNGIPRAILVITDRFEKKHGMMMSVDWEALGCPKHYQPIQSIPPRPQSLDSMLGAAKRLSTGFPFVRVDMYDIEGKAVFGEMTFFPNGCINMAEIEIDGKSMGELLDISAEIKESQERSV